MFGLGVTELLIILVAILVLFGAGKLPNVMGDLGKGLSEFKKGMAGLKDDTQKTVAAPKAEAGVTVVKAAAKKPAAKKTAAKSTAKKATAKKSAPKKPAAKKSTAKKPAAKKKTS